MTDLAKETSLFQWMTRSVPTFKETY
jgi:hypothetical protein